jgi:hypothetical protein
MPEVDWSPGLTQAPTNGVWVVALQGDGVIVQEGDIGWVTGATHDGRAMVRWGDHQCAYPITNLARIPKPRRQHWDAIYLPSTLWSPSPVEGDQYKADLEWVWPWLYQRREAS